MGCKESLDVVEKKKESNKIEVTKEEIIAILRMLEAAKRKLQGTLK